jgi:hypothetical protein
MASASAPCTPVSAPVIIDATTMHDQPWATVVLPPHPLGGLAGGIAGLTAQDDEPHTPEPTLTDEELAQRRTKLQWAPTLSRSAQVTSVLSIVENVLRRVNESRSDADGYIRDARSYDKYRLIVRAARRSGWLPYARAHACHLQGTYAVFGLPLALALLVRAAAAAEPDAERSAERHWARRPRRAPFARAPRPSAWPCGLALWCAARRDLAGTQRHRPGITHARRWWR